MRSFFLKDEKRGRCLGLNCCRFFDIERCGWMREDDFEFGGFDEVDGVLD